MSKWSTNLFSRNTEKKTIDASVLIQLDENYIEDVFQQVYDTEKFCRWFNFFPIVWISFDRKYMEIGATGTIHFTIPFFYYKLRVIEVIPNKFIKLEGAGGMMRGGGAFFNFEQNEDGIILSDPHVLSGVNVLIHKYYSYFLAPGHVPFMNWRYSILKKNLFKEIKKKERRKEN